MTELDSDKWAHSVDTDLDSHHIEGRVAMAEGFKGHFKVPLISHVEGNLWQGGCRGGVHLPEDIQYVISLYRWEEYIVARGCQVVTVTMYDSSDEPDHALLYGLADLANSCMDAGKTLVHCQAGLNRSGLVSALTLMQRGYTAEKAIALLREKRCDLVLCNDVFEKWLLAQ